MPRRPEMPARPRFDGACRSRGPRPCLSTSPTPPHSQNLRDQVEHGAIVLHSLPVAGPPGASWDPDAPGARNPGRPAVAPDLPIDHRRLRGTSAKWTKTHQRRPPPERQRLRLAAEQAVAAGPWPSLILRPAAIYGPGRGVHVRLHARTFKLLGDGSNYISRIHVDDLARVVVAALFSDLTGAYPLADDEPCPSREIVAFCAELLGLPLPPSAGPEELDETRRSDRRVDGSKIRSLLGVDLAYPSYRQGIPAALRESTPELRAGRGQSPCFASRECCEIGKFEARNAVTVPLGRVNQSGTSRTAPETAAGCQTRSCTASRGYARGASSRAAPWEPPADRSDPSRRRSSSTAARSRTSR